MIDLPTKALSIRQPWTWAILEGGKDIENRTWRTNFRGRILLHAGKVYDDDAEWFIRQNIDIPFPGTYLTGGYVGTVEIVDVVTKSDSPWFVGPVGFVLANPEPLPFRPAVGRLGIHHAIYRP